MTDTSPLPVTPADRALYRELFHVPDEEHAQLDRGDFDSFTELQAIARHRLNTRPAVSADVVEEANVFYERGQHWTRWHGGFGAPSDWNGGRVLLASGEIDYPYQSDDDFDWQHYVSETDCLEPGCIVGYISASLPQSGEAEGLKLWQQLGVMADELRAKAKRFQSTEDSYNSDLCLREACRTDKIAGMVRRAFLTRREGVEVQDG